MEDFSGSDSPSPIEIQRLDAAQINLAKAERVWKQILVIVEGDFGKDHHPEYDRCCEEYRQLLAALPTIDGCKPTGRPRFLEAVAQRRPASKKKPISIEVEAEASDPGAELRNYRHRLEQARRTLTRTELEALIRRADTALRAVRSEVGSIGRGSLSIPNATWKDFRASAKRIGELLGPASGNKPALWADFLRHLEYGKASDLACIEERDWPSISKGLRAGLYGPNEPVPSPSGDLVSPSVTPKAEPKPRKLQWAALTAEDFERLIFELISSDEDYERVALLTHTNAPDRGRDISAFRVVKDRLLGTSHQRVIVQCKHWLSRGIGSFEVSQATHQMDFWTNPPVDILIIATSGRFTSDAVQWVDDRRADAKRPAILLWPEVHLEKLLDGRPDLIARFGMRD